MSVGDPSRSATATETNNLAGPAPLNGTIEPQSLFPRRSSATRHLADRSEIAAWLHQVTADPEVSPEVSAFAKIVVMLALTGVEIDFGRLRNRHHVSPEDAGDRLAALIRHGHLSVLVRTDGEMRAFPIIMKTKAPASGEDRGNLDADRTGQNHRQNHQSLGVNAIEGKGGGDG